MKIGAFARKFDVSVDTVRYYMEVGLLLPQKDGKNYIFCSQDMEDMKTICEFKNYNFPIQSLCEIMSMRRQLNSKDNRINELIVKKLLDRCDEITLEIRELEKARDSLNQKIIEYTPIEHEPARIGVPLEFVPMLKCPQCGSDFSFENSYIERGQIFSGDAVCTCGCAVKIRDGNIIMNDGPHMAPDLQGHEWWDGYIGMPITELSFRGTRLVNTMNKCYIQLEKWLRESPRFDDNAHKVILTCENNCGRFLLYYLMDRPEGRQFLRNATVVMYVSSEEIPTSVRELMGAFHEQPKIVFIIGNTYRLPLAPKCIDYFIDDNSSFTHFMRDKRFLIDVILDSGYLHDQCEIYGVLIPDFLDVLNAQHYRFNSQLLSEIIFCQPRPYLSTDKLFLYNKFDKNESKSDAFIAYRILRDTGEPLH